MVSQRILGRGEIRLNMSLGDMQYYACLVLSPLA